jgi:hypothetical protein
LIELLNNMRVGAALRGCLFLKPRLYCYLYIILLVSVRPEIRPANATTTPLHTVTVGDPFLPLTPLCRKCPNHFPHHIACNKRRNYARRAIRVTNVKSSVPADQLALDAHLKDLPVIMAFETEQANQKVAKTKRHSSANGR